MAYSVEVLADEPVVIVRMEQGFKFEKELPGAHEEIARRVKQIEARHVYRVTDFSALTLTFSELQTVLYLETRGGPGSAADARIRNVFVGSGEWVQMAGDSLVQTQYGKIPTLVFSTVSEALVYVRAMLGHTPSV
jgi:hypothetical protein